MLQKLENAYLAILRFVVILVAGLLLVAVVILVLNSMKAFKSEPIVKKAEPHVSHEFVIKQLTSKDTTKQSGNAKLGDSSPSVNDPNNKYYDQIATSLIKFVQKHAEGYESINKSKIIEYVKKQANTHTEEETKTKYAKGLASTIDKILDSPQITKMAKNQAPVDIVEKVMDSYSTEFAAQIEEEKQNAIYEQQLYAARKAEAIQSLYIAAGAFGTFLMIVFISIIIRIERNLRHLDPAHKN
ncbi:hypothetical protein [Methylophilus sp. YYY-1]|uniref:hypothetical protein n=1 Tax=Methylophilus sp. YYY-1 TaxID=2682087 RepID=UPI0023B244E4|nr:hypothetical protein [Methylophilus sp. YYY-1]MDF0377893.1 hypothetical protein [Methylophilus sp. YYY-1]